MPQTDSQYLNPTAIIDSDLFSPDPANGYVIPCSFEMNEDKVFKYPADFSYNSMIAKVEKMEEPFDFSCTKIIDLKELFR